MFIIFLLNVRMSLFRN